MNEGLIHKMKVRQHKGKAADVLWVMNSCLESGWCGSHSSCLRSCAEGASFFYRIEAWCICASFLGRGMCYIWSFMKSFLLALLVSLWNSSLLCQQIFFSFLEATWSWCSWFYYILHKFISLLEFYHIFNLYLLNIRFTSSMFRVLYTVNWVC